MRKLTLAFAVILGVSSVAPAFADNFTNPYSKKTLLYGDQSQNVSVTVVNQQQDRGGDRDHGDRGRGGHGGWGGHPGWGRPGWGHHDEGAAVVGGIIGGFIGNIFAPKPEPQVVVVQPVAPAPWSSEWYNYCANKYRSFDAKTGYFIGYDGQRYFCQ